MNMTDVGTNTPAVWFPVVTLILGFATNEVSAWLRDDRTRKRERESRKATSRGQRLERRSNFQRDTLLNLQDAIAKLSRATGKMHHLDSLGYRTTGKWGGGRFPEDLDNEAHQANVSVMLLTSRVRDEKIRLLADLFRNEANQVPLCRSEAAAGSAASKMSAALTPLYARTGEILRKLEDEEDLVEGSS